jgi:hypothetical protein
MGAVLSNDLKFEISLSNQLLIQTLWSHGNRRNQKKVEEFI